ncbi:hypothetical protein [Ekhidna sp.]|uniref:hypothetical protein n=1 Tax=Ekhidna sp. TaxID=2608089 RepID=UPI003B59A710
MKITISYQPQHLPPPFAYACVLDIDISATAIDASLQLEYLDRDAVSDDELRAEGFTRDDDFEWNGKISPKWKEDIEQLAKLSVTENPDANIYLHIALDGRQVGFPKNIGTAELIFQEVFQAILEQSEIESPLEFQSVLEDKKHMILFSFSKRMIEFDGKVSFNWEIGRELIKLIYNMDFESLEYSKQQQNNSVYIGDEYWYLLPKSTVHNLSSLLDVL